MPKVQDDSLRHKQLSPRVRSALRHASPTDRLEILLLYDTDRFKPMEARGQFETIDDLHVAQGWPPTLPIAGSKDAIVTALSDPLTIGAAMNFQDYADHHLRMKRDGKTEPRGRS